jgi:polysaccharide export outer membrane protein
MRSCSKIAAVMLLAATTISSACTAAQTTTPAAGSPSVSAAPNVAYRLGLGDKVRIQVFGEPDLSGEFQVSGGGALAMPLIGDVPAVGLTASELEGVLATRYRGGYLRDPRIVVEVYDFRPYFILGEVEKPGRYPSLEGITAMNAIATAGGFTYRANKKKIFVRRAGETVERAEDLNSDVIVQPGDVIRVPERHF